MPRHGASTLAVGDKPAGFVRFDVPGIRPDGVLVPNSNGPVGRNTKGDSDSGLTQDLRCDFAVTSDLINRLVIAP